MKANRAVLILASVFALLGVGSALASDPNPLIFISPLHKAGNRVTFSGSATVNPLVTDTMQAAHNVSNIGRVYLKDASARPAGILGIGGGAGATEHSVYLAEITTNGSGQVSISVGSGLGGQNGLVLLDSTTAGTATFTRQVNFPVPYGSATVYPPIRIGIGSVEPTAVVEGAVYANSATHLPYYYDGSAWQPMVSSGGSGVLVYHAFKTTGEVITITTVVPFDDTIPTASEGGLVLSITQTAASATDRIRLVSGTQYTAGAGSYGTCFLQRDSDPAFAVSQQLILTGGYQAHFEVAGEMVAGDTSSHTYNLRCGPDSTIGGTMYVNGNGIGTRLFGGVFDTTLTLDEYTP